MAPKMSKRLIRPTVPLLADPNYHHPRLSMFPPSYAQRSEALMLRRAQAAQAAAESAIAEAAAREKAEAEAKANAEAELKAKVAEEVVAAKKQWEADAAAAAMTVAAEKAAKNVQTTVETDLKWCYHCCAQHPICEKPMLSGKPVTLGGEKNESKEKENRKAKQGKKGQKEDKDEDGDGAAKNDTDEKPNEGKSGKEKSNNLGNCDNGQKGILKEGKDKSTQESSSFGCAYPKDVCSHWYNQGPPPRFSNDQPPKQVHFDPSVQPASASSSQFLPIACSDIENAYDPDVPFDWYFKTPVGAPERTVMHLTFAPNGRMYDQNGVEVVLHVSAPPGMSFVQASQVQPGTARPNSRKPLQEIFQGVSSTHHPATTRKSQPVRPTSGNTNREPRKPPSAPKPAWSAVAPIGSIEPTGGVPPAGSLNDENEDLSRFIAADSGGQADSDWMFQ